MSHLSIAVLKKQTSQNSGDNLKYEYLVVKTDQKKFKFFDHKSNGFGVRFDYSGFKMKVINRFELTQIFDEEGNSDCFVDILPFKSSKRDPFATSYEYLFSAKQVDHIDEKLRAKESGFWGNLMWLSEQQLFDNHTNWDPIQKFIFEREESFNQPEFSNILRTNLESLVKAKENGKLVIFAGAGISIDSNVPGWSKLIEELKSNINIQEKDFLKTAQIHHDLTGKKEHNDRIQEMLKHGQTKFNPIHGKIIDLKPIHILTTNFDVHFEQVIYERNARYSIVKKDSDLPYSKGTSLFIKMHGDFDERNLVFKEKDYENYSSNFPLVESFIKGIFASKLVLFIGFSFTDPNLIQIIKSVNQVLKDDNQSPYLLSVHASGNNKRDYNRAKKKIGQNGVKVVEFEDKAVNDYFDQVSSEDDKIYIDELSSVGQKTYKFLKVVEEFDTFSDALNNLDINDQLTNSILRFKGMNSVPPKVFESITPFKLKRTAKSESTTEANYNPYNPFHLETLNESLLSFLAKKMNKKGELDIFSKIDNPHDGKVQKFNEALGLLYASGVHYIVRKNDTTPLQIVLNPIKSDYKCNCQRCLCDRFEFDRLLKELNAGSTKMISNNNRKIIDLTVAYGFQKTGQVAKAYYALEELKATSWKNHEYIQFFLASYNQKLLNPLMNSLNDRSLSEEDLESIRDKIKSIDLNHILFELPINGVVKQALVIVKENSLFQSTRLSVEKELINIIENYRKYKKGGYRSTGPYYWYNAETAFFILLNFYHKNMLFNDEYDYFLDLAHKYLEAMIASYSTSSEYEERLTHYSTLFATVFISYGRPKEIKSLLNKYDVDYFEFENQDKTVEDILEFMYSFCISGYRVDTFSKKEVYRNELYNTLNNESFFFKSKMATTLNNFLIFLAKLKLNQFQVNNVIDKTLNYLITNPILNLHGSLNHFMDFISVHTKLINEDHTKRLIDFVLSENIWSDNLVAPLCKAITSVPERVEFLGKETLENIIWRTKKRSKWNVHPTSMIPFYSLLRKEQKIEFVNFIKPYLEKNSVVITAYYSGLWSPQNDTEILESFVSNLMNSCQAFPNYDINSNGFPDKINSFSVWNDLNFFVRLVYANNFFEEKFVKEIHDKIDSKMFRWALSPFSFDYSEFNITWMLALNIKNMIKVLKEISELRKAVKIGLQRNYNEKIARIYIEELTGED